MTQDRLLTNEEIEAAEKEGARKYHEYIGNSKILYSRDGLVLWIQKAIAKAQDLKSYQAGVADTQREIAEWGLEWCEEHFISRHECNI